jgi:hypothetical protein
VLADLAAAALLAPREAAAVFANDVLAHCCFAPSVCGRVRTRAPDLALDLELMTAIS